MAHGEAMAFVFPTLPTPAGLATTRQLVDAGATESTLRHLAAKGHRVLRGVYAPRPGPFPTDTMLQAGALWAGSGAVLTGARALLVHGIPLAREPTTIRFLVPATRRAGRRAGGVLTARTRHVPPGQPKDGLAVAPVERALVDASRYLELTDAELRATTLAALQQRRTTADRVAHELEKTKRSSGGVLDGVVAFRGGAWSVPEAVLADGVRRHRRLPVMVANPRLVDADGRRIGTPDGWFPESGVAVQVHSRQFHEGTDAEGRDRWSATLAGDVDYTRHGITVVPVAPATLSDDLDAFLDKLADIVARLAGRAPQGVRMAGSG